MGVHDKVRFKIGHLLENETGIIITVHKGQFRVILDSDNTTVWAFPKYLEVIR